MGSKILFSLIFILGLALFLQSCAPALYKPLPQHASGDVSYEHLLEGRKLYVSKCGSCHSLHLPHQYSEQVWFHNIDEMQVRAKINDSEKKLISDYLVYGIKLSEK